MEKYAILLGYFDKQISFIEKIYKEIISVDLAVYEKRYLFSMKVQQFYTALEDLFKQIAKAFENHIENMNHFHKEMLVRMNTEIPTIRPTVISHQSLVVLDKIRAFRHFIRHAYDCELNENELRVLQAKLAQEYEIVRRDLIEFRSFIQTLSN